MNWPTSPDAPLLGDGKRAVAIDQPSSVDELRSIVANRASEGLAIYPQGGKTSLEYGGIPRRPGVALDVSRLDQVIDYPAADMTITVQAGITLAKLQATLAENGQFLPLDAPDPEKATLGGIYATNTCGPRRFGWGRPRDMIIGVSFVTADGKEIKGGGRVVKNVAGYDLPKLLTGSMGSLGVITQLTLKVRPRPESSALVAVEFSSMEAAVQAVHSLNLSATRPVAVELLNGVGGEWVGLPSAKATLVLAYEDNANSVAWQVERICQEVRPSAARILESSDFSAVWSGLQQFSALRQGPFSFVSSFRRSEAATNAGLLSPGWAARVHAGNGIIEAHSVHELPIEQIEENFAHLTSSDGVFANAVVTRCPTAWKERRNVWGKPRGEWAVMQKIKTALDPAGVMNPGRYIGIM